MKKIQKKKKNNVVSFPPKSNVGDREVEAIIFAAIEPLEIETIESKIYKKIDCYNDIGYFNILRLFLLYLYFR